jgi:hypothetical protein
MANQWFRSWHGAPTDPKWLAIGRKCDLAPGMVFAIAWALMDRASQADQRGSFAGYDADEIAAFMGCDEQDVCNVIQVMADKGMVRDDAFTKWSDRQPQRDDGAAERAKAYREREKAKQNNGKREPNATERNRTLDKDKDTDKKVPKGTSNAVRKRTRHDYTPAFEAFWKEWLLVEGGGDKQPAFDAWEKLPNEDQQAAHAVARAWFERWRAGHRDASAIHASTYLNNRRFDGFDPSRQAQGQSPPGNGYTPLAEQQRNQSRPTREPEQWQPEMRYLTGS